MKYRAGLRFVAFLWMGVLMHSADECRLQTRIFETQELVNESLKLFENLYPKNTVTWNGGFPLLQEKKDSRANGSRVQCSLLFMAQGLKKVREDQKVKRSVELQKKLNETICSVNKLALCAKEKFSSKKCLKSPEPQMPKDELKKQWSRTLLKMAKAYLDWLASKAQSQTTPSTLPLRGGVNSV